jgi:hypothetical protein
MPYLWTSKLGGARESEEKKEKYYSQAAFEGFTGH